MPSPSRIQLGSDEIGNASPHFGSTSGRGSLFLRTLFVAGLFAAIHMMTFAIRSSSITTDDTDKNSGLPPQKQINEDVEEVIPRKVAERIADLEMRIADLEKLTQETGSSESAGPLRYKTAKEKVDLNGKKADFSVKHENTVNVSGSFGENTTAADSLPTVNSRAKHYSYKIVKEKADLKEFGKKKSEEPFCVPWTVKADSWWTHHPEWEIFLETDELYCFRLMMNKAKLQFMRALYETQFHGNCSEVLTSPMWSSGWGADMYHLLDNLLYAHSAKVPLQVNKKQAWHYAAPVEAGKAHENAPPAKAVCSLKNMFCYFLQLSNCEPQTPTDTVLFDDNRGPSQIFEKTFNRWHLEFMTRQRTWLRHRIYQFVQNQTLTQPCTVFHVRRGDSVMRLSDAVRRYHPISEYVGGRDRVPVHRNILLLTDDQNAISEAKADFPEYNWMFLNRPRYRANEGGWERHLPSNDPAFEMVVLLSTFSLAKQCQSLVHTNSNLAVYLREEMRASNQSTKVLDLDAGRDDVFSVNNENTVNVSRSFEQKTR